MKRILLTHGKEALVSDEDFGPLSRYKWHYAQVGYAARGTWDGKKRSAVYMHREVLGAKKGEEVDHINGDRLDNRRSNLRKCTHQQNMINWDNVRGVSEFRGVSPEPEKRRRTKWKAQIQVSGKNKLLGRFMNELDAAKAYDKAARELHGEFARPNFDMEGNRINGKNRSVPT